MAATYGWSLAAVRALTDEQLVFVYLVPGQKRITDVFVRDFEYAVESVRMGTIFAHDSKAYGRWSNGKKQPKARMSDEAIEAAILRIGGMFPGAVERVAG